MTNDERAAAFREGVDAAAKLVTCVWTAERPNNPTIPCGACSGCRTLAAIRELRGAE